MPIILQLSQNYPNPFNPETTIKYEIGETVAVRLDIYNTQGQLIKTLVNEVQSMGEYSVIWNATDNASNKVSSGLYIYYLKCGENYIETRKMTLLK